MTNHQTALCAHVRDMARLIDERSGEYLSIRTLARIVGRHEAYLGRLFRQQMGMSVREYLTCVRMDRAASLIRQGDKVEAVSLEVGYRSKKNFYRQFSKRFGVTPAVYRRQSAVQPSEIEDTVLDQRGSPESGEEPDGIRAADVEPNAGRHISNIADRLKREAILTLDDLEETAARSVTMLSALRTQLRHLHERLLDTPALPETVRSAWTSVARPVSELLRLIGSGPRNAAGPGDKSPDTFGPNKAPDIEPSETRPRLSQRTLRARVQSLNSDVLVATGGPTPTQCRDLQQLKAELVQAISSLKGVVMDNLPELNRLLEQHRMTPIPGVADDPSAGAPEAQAMRAVAR